MWGCLLGPEKLEAEWRTGAGLFCPARKLGPVGQAWPSPWPCGRPAATPACASTPCLWSSWCRSLGDCWSGARAGGSLGACHGGGARASGLDGFLWPKCSLVGEDWPRWLWWLPLGRGFHPCCCGLPWWCRGSPCQVHAKYWWGQWWRLGTGSGGGVSGTSSVALGGPRCLGGRLWSVRPRVWLGWRVVAPWGATGWVLELGRCYRCWSLLVGGALLGSCGAWTSRTAVLGFELLALVLGPKETGGGVVHSSGGCGRGWRAGGDVGENRWVEAVPPSGLEQVAGCGGVGRLFVPVVA